MVAKFRIDNNAFPVPLVNPNPNQKDILGTIIESYQLHLRIILPQGRFTQTKR